jgi:hypothetical protein
LDYYFFYLFLINYKRESRIVLHTFFRVPSCYFQTTRVGAYTIGVVAIPVRIVMLRTIISLVVIGAGVTLDLLTFVDYIKLREAAGFGLAFVAIGFLSYIVVKTHAIRF